MSVGVEESVEIVCEPSTLRGFAGMLEGASNVVEQHANLLAILPATTLIGMRLPGRLATFIELEATFDSEIPARSIVRLIGRVERVTAKSHRASVRLEWHLGERVVGCGSAATIINPAGPTSITCASIKSSHQSLGIKGRVALVTGGSRGIGEATAKLLAMQGAKVAVHYYQGKSDAYAIVDDIRVNGGTANAFASDLADRPSIERMFSAISEAVGPVDILIHCAVGEFKPQSIDTLQPRDYLAELDIALFGLHCCCRLALPHMRRQRWGKIISIGTVATEIPIAGQSKYIASKSAVVGYIRSLAVETARDNVQVNLVAPSMTDTSLIAALPPGLVGKFAEESPSGQLLQPIDVAKAAALLSSDWTRSISGQQLILGQGEAPFL